MIQLNIIIKKSNQLIYEDYKFGNQSFDFDSKEKFPNEPYKYFTEKIVMITHHHSREHNTTTNILILDSLRELNDY